MLDSGTVKVVEQDQHAIGSEVERATLARLRALIRQEGYRDGDKLPPERQLADDLRVSRRTLRSAFAVLESEGRVWRGVGQGTFVGQREPRVVSDLAAVAEGSNPVAVVEARLSLEPIVARFAAQRATSTHLATVKRCAEETGRARTFEAFDEWDERFHKAIVAAADNAVFRAMHDLLLNVWTNVAWGKARTRSFNAEWQRIYARQHRVIAEAIENRDVDRAENLMLEHWQTLRSNLVYDPATR